MKGETGDGACSCPPDQVKSARASAGFVDVIPENVRVDWQVRRVRDDRVRTVAQAGSWHSRGLIYGLVPRRCCRASSMKFATRIPNMRKAFEAWQSLTAARDERDGFLQAIERIGPCRTC